VAPAAYAHGFEERRVPEVANVRRSSGRIHPTEHRQDIGNVIDKREQSSDCAPQYERIAIWDRSTDIGDMDNRLFDPFTGLGAAAGCRNGATVQDQESFKTRRSDPQGVSDHQLRLILSSFVEPHFLHASVRSSNFQPSRIGLIRVMTISVPQSGHADEAPTSSGVSGIAT
jgi:hypothetical protein